MVLDGASNKLPFVSIVVPAYNAETHIRACLESLLAQEYPTGKMERVIVDNMSTDNTINIIRQYGMEPLRCEKRGPSAARNSGIQKASGEIVAFLDSDAIADPQWLKELVAGFEDPAIWAIGGKIEPARIESGPELHAQLTRMLDQEKHLAEKGTFMLPFVATANAAFRKKALMAVGGFDENFLVGEDADLCWRLQETGGKLAYAEQARVRHYHRSQRPQYFRQIFQYGKATSHLFAKHQKKTGRKTWIAWGHHIRLLKACAVAPVYLCSPPNPWERLMPLYDICTNLAWTWGRIVGAFRYGVITF
ncbi:MAG: glycosyltransferase [Candidatus Sumerlaeia bacterium]